MIDKMKVGSFAMEAIDSIAEGFEGDVMTGDMMLVVEIRTPPQDEDDPEDRGRSHVMTYCSDDRSLLQLGLLRAATLGAESQDADE